MTSSQTRAEWRWRDATLQGLRALDPTSTGLVEQTDRYTYAPRTIGTNPTDIPTYGDVSAAFITIGGSAGQVTMATARLLGRTTAGPGAAEEITVGVGLSLAAGQLKTGGATTVASLPAAATAGAGARSFVTDANATTFLSIVAGGGANAVPVVSDGANWLIG